MLRSASKWKGTNRNSDKCSQRYLRPACRLTARRRRRLMTGRGAGRDWQRCLADTTRATSVCVYVWLHQCVYVQTGSSVRAEMRRNGLRKKRAGRVRMALGIPGPRGKAELVFPRKGGTSFPSVDSSRLSSSPLKGTIRGSRLHPDICDRRSEYRPPQVRT